MQKSIHGLDGFIWATGVVEDRFDPLYLGRCKVRYFHHHTDDKSEIPTKDLPWSYPLQPLDSGTNVVGPTEGTWVIAFFRDGILAQQPVMLGVIPGIPEKPANPEIGFNDPRPDSVLVGHQVPRDPEPPEQHDDGSGTFWDERSPKSRFPEERYLKESTFFRTGRNEFISETIVQQKRDNRFIGQVDIPESGHIPGTGSDIFSPAFFFEEPEIPYGAEYPYNHIYYSEGGHLIEVDDTPNEERYHRYHRLGSYEEIRKDGSRVVKTVNDDTEIVLKRKHIHIEASKSETIDWGYKIFVNKDAEAGFHYDIEIGEGGDINIQTDGGKLNINLNGDYNIYVNGKATIEVEEDLIATVHRDAHVKVDFNLRATVGVDADVWVGNNATIEVQNDLRETVHGNVIGYVGKDKVQVVKGDYKLIVGGTISSLAYRIENVAITDIDSIAGLTIKDASPIITHTAGVVYNNAPLTSCTGELLGITTDNAGDVTPAGSPGPFPYLTPDFIPQFIYDAEKAIEAELDSIASPLDIFEEYVEQILVQVEINIDLSNIASESNANSPAGMSSASGGAGGAGGAGGGGGGGGGSRGGEPIYGVDAGFLWKPTSDSNGNLVVLLPSGTRAGSATIRDPNGNVIGNGRYSGVANGGREHYRFDTPGASFPPNSSVSFGNNSVSIPNTGTRYEGAGEKPPETSTPSE